jgi:hypothetical protein
MMKYLVHAYPEGSTTAVFKCHVIAEDPGAAMEKVKQHLIAKGNRELAFELKTAIDIGATVDREILLLE